MNTRNKLRVGDSVEVLSKEEILKTLDCNGRLQEMPFMPEMFQFCGKRFKVYKIAHKTCDYSAYPFYSRRMAETVHLETRCDGAAHGGCEAGCLLYWKNDWLKLVDEETPALPAQSYQAHTQATASGCTEEDIFRNVRPSHADVSKKLYSCQMTQIPFATSPLAWWDVRQYIDDLRSRNASPRRVLNGLTYWFYFSIMQSGIGVGRSMRWLYNKISPLFGGSLYPRNAGLIPQGQQTPLVKLNLQPGELVRVKSHQEILQTVDADGKNRGMYWDAELVPYCGKTYKVLRNVTKLIGEQSGELKEMKSPCIVLENVICQARYSSCRYFCPKSMFPFWRETWLERVEPPQN
jgi:hypothetical protein